MVDGSGGAPLGDALEVGGFGLGFVGVLAINQFLG